MKMYYAFIVNPAAGTGFALTTMQKLEEKLTAASVAYRVFRTERPGHATELAAQLARDAGAGKLIVTHLNPFFPRRTLLEEARAVFPHTQLAEAGAAAEI